MAIAKRVRGLVKPPYPMAFMAATTYIFAIAVILAASYKHSPYPITMCARGWCIFSMFFIGACLSLFNIYLILFRYIPALDDVDINAPPPVSVFRRVCFAGVMCVSVGLMLVIFVVGLRNRMTKCYKH